MRQMTVRVSDDLREQLGRTVGPGEINAFVREAIAEKLGRHQRDEQLAALERRVEALERQIRPRGGA